MRNKYLTPQLLIGTLTTFFVFGFIIYPLWQLVLAGHSQPNALTLVVKKQVFTACFNSVLLSVITVIGSAVIGTYFAYSFHYKKIWLKPLLSTLILLPIAIPPIVGVISYLFLLGENGLLMKLSGIKNFTFEGWTAIISIHLYSFYPLFYIFVGNALKTIDSSIIEASSVLGATKFRTFYSIILPQIRPALLGASLLTFMASMASFSAPFIFGGSHRFLTTEIYYSKINGDTSLSALLSLLLAGLSVIILFCFKLYSKRLPAVGSTKGTAKKNPLTEYRKYSYPTTFISILFGVVISLPILSLVMISLLPDNVLMENGLNAGFSFNNYTGLFTDAELVRPFLNSLKTSLVAVAMTLLAGLVIGHLLRGKQNTFKFLLETASSIPYGIPGTVIAICLILSFNVPTLFTFNTVLVGTFWILPIAYTIRNLAIATQAIKAGLHAVDASVEEAANSLGAGKFKTWRSITLPLIYSSIIDGGLLVFINSFGEFVATVLLYNYSTRTMPIEIYSQVRLYNNGIAASYGVILFLIVISIIFITRKLTNVRLR